MTNTVRMKAISGARDLVCEGDRTLESDSLDLDYLSSARDLVCEGDRTQYQRGLTSHGCAQSARDLVCEGDRTRCTFRHAAVRRRRNWPEDKPTSFPPRPERRGFSEATRKGACMPVLKVDLNHAT